MEDHLLLFIFGVILLIVGTALNMKARNPLNTIGFYLQIIGLIIMVVALIFLLKIG